jgi:hypothetical protein
MYSTWEEAPHMSIEFLINFEYFVSPKKIFFHFLKNVSILIHKNFFFDKKIFGKKKTTFYYTNVPNLIKVINVKAIKVLWGIIITHLIYLPCLGRQGYYV